MISISGDAIGDKNFFLHVDSDDQVLCDEEEDWVDEEDEEAI